MVDLPFSAKAFAEQLLSWYGSEGRDLPWRGTRDPYRIWLSEIMLQQTTVAAVIDYYQRFLAAFPCLDALAAASQDEVIQLWAGLGYYSRARNLHVAAKVVMSEHGGIFPDQVEQLQKLPGVGRSTAGAIASLAFERRAPILDGNVRRVLCRLCAWQEAPRSSKAEKQLWHWSDQLTPEERVHDYTQAIMDLGATVCVPRQPLCEHCPAADLCLARKQGLERELPRKQPGKAVPTRIQAALLVEGNGAFLVRQRPAEGFLGGLWEFPAVDVGTDESAQEKINNLKQDLALRGKVAELGRIKHVYSHFRLELHLYHLRSEPVTVTEERGRWLEPAELETLALHGAHKKALAHMKEIGE